LEAQQQTQPDKPFALTSEAHWHRANKTFTYTTMGLNPKTFFEVPRSQIGAISLSHHP